MRRNQYEFRKAVNKSVKTNFPYFVMKDLGMHVKSEISAKHVQADFPDFMHLCFVTSRQLLTLVMAVPQKES